MRTLDRLFHAALALFLATLFTACGDSGGAPPAGSDLRWPGEEWQVADPAGEGLDPAVLGGAREYAFAAGRNTQGVVVIRGGVLVAEWYAPGRDASSLATSWSAGKSFASTLVGIAVDQGLIDGIDVSSGRFYPDWLGTAKEDITLRMLLQMRSGLEWNEARDDPAFHALTADQLTASARRQPARAPGARWNYSSADSMLLSGVIEAASGRSAGDFAQEFLFGPIGMRAQWWTDEVGHTLTYCCVDTTTRDFARFGLLFARGGEWNGRRVVSREWVEEATTPIPEVPFYALQWWTNLRTITLGGLPVRVFAARGLHEQNIYVFPDLDLVVVRNGLYTRVGNGEPVRAGANFLTTLPPASWDDVAFLMPILQSIDPGFSSPAAAAGIEAIAADPFVDPTPPWVR